MRNRRNRLREDELWDELKYWLENPVTDVEESIRQQEEQNYVNAVLDKVFGEEPTKITDKEPYLTYEDLLNEDEVISDGDTATIAPLEGKVTKSYPTDPYMEIDEREDLTEEEKIAKKEEVAQIQANAAAKNREIDVDNAIKQGKLWGGAALQVAGAMTPFGKIAPAAKAGTAIAKKLAPKVGRKIANEIATGTVEGTMSGAVEGLGRGMVEDENPLKTAAQDATAGLLLGSAGGAVGGEVAHVKRKKNLDELVDKRKDWGIAFTKQSGKPKEAIDKLLEQKQGFVPKAVNKKGIGDIDFVWGDSKKGLQHIIERREKQGYNSQTFLEELPELFEKGDKYTKPNHPNRYYIGTSDKESAIRTDYNQKKRDWLTSAYYLDKNIPLQDSAGFRTYDQTHADKQFFPLSDLQKDNLIVAHPPQTLNPNLENISKKPSSFDEWLEELKRKRRLRGW